MKNYSLLRALIRVILESKTPRVSDLSQEDIILVIEDILGREPLATYTEKLAGQNLTVYVENGEVYGQFKDHPKSSWSDIGDVASTIREFLSIAKIDNVTFGFEILRPENRPDYLDYAIGDTTIAVEFTGALTNEMAKVLNREQSELKFLTQSDLVKRPRPLSQETHSLMSRHLDSLVTTQKVKKEKKEEIEKDISSALIEIFGESIFGGPPEGVFVTGVSKSFKIPEKNYADLQRLSAPIYAVFSAKSKIPASVIADRFQKIASGSDPSGDGIWRDLSKYFKAASVGFLPGYKTFFSKNEASDLLRVMERIVEGDVNAVTSLLRTVRSRIGNRREWVPTRI